MIGILKSNPSSPAAPFPRSAVSPEIEKLFRAVVAVSSNTQPQGSHTSSPNNSPSTGTFASERPVETNKSVTHIASPLNTKQPKVTAVESPHQKGSSTSSPNNSPPKEAPSAASEKSLETNKSPIVSPNTKQHKTCCNGIVGGIFLILGGIALMTYHGLAIADITPSMDLPNSFLIQCGVGTATGLLVGGGALWIWRSRRIINLENPCKPSTRAYFAKLILSVAVVAAFLFASAQFCQDNKVNFDLFDLDSSIVNLSIGTVCGLVILNALRFSLNYYREKKRAENLEGFVDYKKIS